MTDEPGGGSERRRAERVPMAAGGPVAVVGARLSSVSPFGMKIESPVAIGTGTILQFRLNISGEKADVDARVASCVAGGGERRGYEIGLEFLELSSAVRDRLRDVLQQYEGGRRT
ncbi:MAG TPA: PilZ domain-containing protein [Vicinamibacteria bacterium]